MKPEPYDIPLLLARIEAAEARAIAAEKLSSKLAEDARLILFPLVKLPPNIFTKRPHMFRIVFSALIEAMRND